MSQIQELRELRQEISKASDRQLARLVPVLDSLPQRSLANTLLDGARPRLRELRPPRRMTLIRLLFLPLDPLIVNPGEWKPGLGLLPRSALSPLAEALRQAEPASWAQWQARLDQENHWNATLLREVGASLWPAAAALPRKLPPGWGETELPPHVFPELAELCATPWQHAPALMRLRLAGADGPPETLARPAFRQIATQGSQVTGLCLRVLLPHSAKPARLVALVTAMSAALAPAAELALDDYLRAVDPGLDGTELGSIAARAASFASLLDDLDHSVTRDQPHRAQLLRALRSSAAERCAELVRTELPLRLTAPLEALLADPAPRDASVEALEISAAALRGLADAGRRLHSSIAAERLLEPSIALLTLLAGRLTQEGPGFTRTDALRLVQILSSPTAAARLG